MSVPHSHSGLCMRLIQQYLHIQENPGCQGVAELYAKVTSCYTEDCNNEVKEAIQQTVGKQKQRCSLFLSFIQMCTSFISDALLQPLSQAGHMNKLINELLVQIGLIKVIAPFAQLHPLT